MQWVLFSQLDEVASGLEKDDQRFQNSFSVSLRCLKQLRPKTVRAISHLPFSLAKDSSSQDEMPKFPSGSSDHVIRRQRNFRPRNFLLVVNAAHLRPLRTFWKDAFASMEMNCSCDLVSVMVCSLRSANSHSARGRGIKYYPAPGYMDTIREYSKALSRRFREYSDANLRWHAQLSGDPFQDMPKETGGCHNVLRAD
jgi:hypothetical protein